MKLRTRVNAGARSDRERIAEVARRAQSLGNSVEVSRIPHGRVTSILTPGRRWSFWVVHGTCTRVQLEQRDGPTVMLPLGEAIQAIGDQL